jgi:thiol:disulfide interchange protein
METGTFPEQQVIDYIQRFFVPVKFSSGTDADQFARFAVAAVPSFIVLTSEGDEVNREIGFLEAGPFIEVLEKARQRALQQGSGS